MQSGWALLSTPEIQPEAEQKLQPKVPIDRQRLK